MESFCAKCNEITELLIKEITKSEKIRGRDIHFTGKEAICSRCGQYVDSQLIDEENQSAAKEAFREKEKLISVHEIEEILKKYKIGKRPLSLLLGWGEGTLTRYIAGDLPTRQYSATLKRIMDDPAYYEEVLEDNRRAITYQAYSRTKKALEVLGYATQQMTVESLCSERLALAAASILRGAPEICLDKLQIMLYYLQGFHMAFWQREMFPEDCFAVGVVPEYRAIAALFPTGKLKDAFHSADLPLLSEAENLLVETLLNRLGCLTVATLKRMITAECFCFLQQEHEYDDELIFSKELIAKHFCNIKEKYRMTSILDITDYVCDVFGKVL